MVTFSWSKIQVGSGGEKEMGLQIKPLTWIVTEYLAKQNTLETPIIYTDFEFRKKSRESRTDLLGEVRGGGNKWRRQRWRKRGWQGGGALMDFMAITVLTSLLRYSLYIIFTIFPIITHLPRLISIKWSIKALGEQNKMNDHVLKN